MGLEQSKTENVFENIQGLQVVRVLPQSPAHVAGLLPFFDIITAVDQTKLLDIPSVSDEFRAYVASRANQQVCFEVYNTRIRAFRDVICFPSSSWGGGGMLGCSVEWSRANQSVERCFHVVEVHPGSPIDKCHEVKAERDYIIGMQRADDPIITLIKDENDFYDRLEMWRTVHRVEMHRRLNGLSANSSPPAKLLFLLYDSEANVIKEINLDLSRDVDTPLGMNVATGLLHLVPPAAEGAGLPAIVSFATSNGVEAHAGMPAPPINKDIGESTATKPGVPNALHYSPLRGSVPPVTHFSPVPPPPPSMPMPMPTPTPLEAHSAAQPHFHSEAVAAHATIPALSRSRPTVVPLTVRAQDSAAGPAEAPARDAPPLQQSQPHPLPQKQGEQCMEVPRDGPDTGIHEGARIAHDHYQPPLGFPKLPPPLQFPIIRPKAPTM